MRNSSQPCQTYSPHFCIPTSLPITNFNHHHQQVLLRPFYSEKSTTILICEGVYRAKKILTSKAHRKQAAEEMKTQAVEVEFLLRKAGVSLPPHSLLPCLLAGIPTYFGSEAAELF